MMISGVSKLSGLKVHYGVQGYKHEGKSSDRVEGILFSFINRLGELGVHRY